MPRRNDIAKILIIGSGPIVIGQSAEFDYSGTQARKALKAEGYEVVLANSNPATIMTDPETADRTYIEPLTKTYLEEIIRQEAEMMTEDGVRRGKFALLPTVGGQTALNLAVELADSGILEKYNVELIGAQLRAIKMAEDRLLFKDAMTRIGLDVPKSALVNNLKDGLDFSGKIGFPLVIRPSFTLGGSGGGIAYNREEMLDILARGLDLSPVHEVLIEEAVLGWKEYELEVMRDLADNVIIVCSIENFDPMGVHTGDSITVAPAQTLTDREYQYMRDASIKVIREIGVETGGSNIQYAVNPANGRMVVIEMNPRVSRSSALASKATGFPIAKIAAKLAVGYTLDEIPNDITKKTPACFEPTIDYVVTKIPRFTFEKFPQATDDLGPQMKSVGEAMAIGRTFKESLQKAMRSLEIGSFGFEPRVTDDLRDRLRVPNADRLWHVGEAFRRGMTVDEVAELTRIDPWFLRHVDEIIAEERAVAAGGIDALSPERLRVLKQQGFADARLAELLGTAEDAVREKREGARLEPVYKTVDTCGAEFEAYTPYLYSTYEPGDDESRPTTRKKIVILGGGPNRIGQGIEFDYCCVHAALALRADGFETIMVNCNPETVSTDYDTSDKLYFEPLTFEDVMEIIDLEKPKGVIVQFGGQTPLKLARALEAAGAPIIGTSPDSIDLAEDRERFSKLVDKLKLRQPPARTARNEEEAVKLSGEVGFPLMVRPSYVLGGRAMEVVFNEDDLRGYIRNAVKVSNDSPVLMDRFLDDATEVDVDALSDGEQVMIGGIMEHVEQAGVHSGDSSCSLPPNSLSPALQDEIRKQVVVLAKALKVIGLMNVQFAIQKGKVYILEVNPRASRTSPFVSKVVGVPLAKVAARCMAGKNLKAQGIHSIPTPKYFAVKAPVFPFIKFRGADPILGPEMKSTGEVMGAGFNFGEAYAKAQFASGVILPRGGRALISVREQDKPAAVGLARDLKERGFSLVATHGTAATIQA